METLNAISQKLENASYPVIARNPSVHFVTESFIGTFIHRCDTVVRLHSCDSSVIALEQVEEEESTNYHVAMFAAGLEKPVFLEKVFRFLGFFKVLMYEDLPENYDPEIREEYLIHDTPICMPHHL